jgi:hypothetical protein
MKNARQLDPIPQWEGFSIPTMDALGQILCEHILSRACPIITA